MNPIQLSTNKYVQIVLIVAILLILYKLLNSDLFKGVGKASEGVGTALQGVGTGVSTASQGTGEAISTVVTATANVYKNYAELVGAVPTKLGTWTGLLENPKNKPWLDLYENLPWSKVSVYSKPFFIPSSVYNKGIQRQNPEWIRNNVAIPVKNSVGFYFDRQIMFGAIDKLQTWYDFMTLAERFKPMYNLSLRAFMDNNLNEDDKVELAKIMNTKPIFLKA
jgi:hypothetical protein